MQRPRSVTGDDVAAWLERLYVGVPGARLRREDRRKAEQVAALLVEIQQALARVAADRAITLVDAAAGKTYVGLAAAQLLLEPEGRRGRVVAIEREPERLQVARAQSSEGITIECRQGDVGDRSLWPDEPDVVAALHACGPAADAIIDRCIETRARHLLLVPCCTGAHVPAAASAPALADRWGFPRHAAVRRRLIQALVDAQRTLLLEAAGWQTEVVEFVPPTLTPHNLLFRARRVEEPGRMADAARRLATLRTTG